MLIYDGTLDAYLVWAVVWAYFFSLVICLLPFSHPRSPSPHPPVSTKPKDAPKQRLVKDIQQKICQTLLCHFGWSFTQNIFNPTKPSKKNLIRSCCTSQDSLKTNRNSSKKTAKLLKKKKQKIFKNTTQNSSKVMLHLQKWWPKLRPNGLIAGHDFAPEKPWRFPGPYGAATRFARARGVEQRLLGLLGTTFVMKKGWCGWDETF